MVEEGSREGALRCVGGCGVHVVGMRWGCGLAGLGPECEAHGLRSDRCRVRCSRVSNTVDVPATNDACAGPLSQLIKHQPELGTVEYVELKAGGERRC